MCGLWRGQGVGAHTQVQSQASGVGVGTPGKDCLVVKKAGDSVLVALGFSSQDEHFLNVPSAAMGAFPRICSLHPQRKPIE